MPTLKNRKTDIQSVVRNAGYALSAIKTEGSGSHNNSDRIKEVETLLKKALKSSRKLGVELSRKGLC